MRHLLFTTLLSAIVSTTCAAATTSWTEDVQLHDGRVIVITQKRRLESAYSGNGFGSVPRESWVTAILPDQGGRDVEWHESLVPHVLNEYGGHWYLIAVPPTWNEFNAYGRPRPAYVPYTYLNGRWQRISMSSVPAAVYGTNLLIDHVPPAGVSHISIDQKRTLNSNSQFPDHARRVDPGWNTHW